MPARMFHHFFCVTLFILSCSAAFAQSTIHVPDSNHPTIQSGIDAAVDGDTVVVAAGTYYEHINFGAKAITVVSSDGAGKTIIDGSLNGTVATLGSTSETPAIFDGFTIQNGVPDTNNPSGIFNDGGGIDIVGNATVQNNTVTGNQSCGIDVVDGSNSTIRNNHILHNQDGNSGGNCGLLSDGIYIHPMGTSAPFPIVTVTENLIEENATGGILQGGYDVTAIIVGNTIRNNGWHATDADPGFGISLGDYILSTVIANNAIYGNAGIGISSNFFGSVSIINNTLYGNFTSGYNSPTSSASEIYAPTGTLLVNNIVYATSTKLPPIACDAYDDSRLPVVLDHNDVINPTSVPSPNCDLTSYGNISVNPQFRSLANDDFHLATSSPAIDVGNNSAPHLPATDLDGLPRIQDATGRLYPIVDMGAFEFSGLQELSPTTLTLVGKPNAFLYTAGSDIQFTATAISSAGVPVGPVSLFMDYANPAAATALLGSTGQAVLTAHTVPPGNHCFHATYVGLAPFTPADSVKVCVEVEKYFVSLALTSVPNPSFVGKPVTFTLTITNQDTDSIGPISLVDTFNNQSVVLATLLPDSTGIATFKTSTLAPGIHNVDVSYAGDSMHTSAITGISQQVLSSYPTFTTITSSVDPSVINQSVTFTAILGSAYGTPTGSVQFSDGTTTLSTQQLNASGIATFSTSTLTLGNHPITATYIPSGTFSGSSGSLIQTVQIAPYITISSLPNPSAIGQNVTFTAAIQPTGIIPSGTVAFFDGPTNLGGQALNSSGVAAFSTNKLTIGTHTITAVASFTSAGSLSASTASLVQTVVDHAAGSAITLIASPSSGWVNVTPIILTATAPTSPGYGTPTGNVVFSLNGTALATRPLVNGVATYSSLLPLGTDQVVANYLGDMTYPVSTSNTVLVTVTPDPTITTLTASPNPGIQGEAVTFTTTVAATTGAITPTGTTTILDGTTTIATFPATTTTFTTSSLAPGTHSLVAVFTPDAAFGPSQSMPLSLTILAESFTLTLSEPTITIQTGHHASLTATLTSLGGLTAPFTFSCSSLPAYASCAWGQTTVTLPPNGSVDTKLTIDTDEIPGFYSSVDHTDSPSPTSRVAFALLLPLSLFGFKRRRNLRSLVPLFLLAIFATTLTACGANEYPYSTAPGTYIIPITATGYLNGPATPVTQTVNLTLIVTP